jgi:hypothetical protein
LSINMGYSDIFSKDFFRPKNSRPLGIFYYLLFLKGVSNYNVSENRKLSFYYRLGGKKIMLLY